MLKRIFGIFLAGAIVIATSAYAAFQFSPWPSVWLIRQAFDKGAAAASEALEKHVPAGITRLPDQSYYQASSDSSLDVYYPARLEGAGDALPVIVWIHGGAWISGSKGDVANYLKILVDKGYAGVAIDYSLAPGAVYPTPVKQLNEALAFIGREAKRLHIDPSRIFLAGDSAGAQIAAQYGLVASNPAYAQQMGIAPSIEQSQLRGLILYCGPHDATNINFEGGFGGFLRTVMWSYLGRKDFAGDPRLEEISVVPNLTANYPPAFISVGNGDPLAPHSKTLAQALASQGTVVETLFFPDDYAPSLPHEYQFNLDGEAGRLALEKSLAFLAAQSR